MAKRGEKWVYVFFASSAAQQAASRHLGRTLPRYRSVLHPGPALYAITPAEWVSLRVYAPEAPCMRVQSALDALAPWPEAKVEWECPP